MKFIEGNGREGGDNVIKSWIVIPVPRLLAIICDTVSSFLVVLHSPIPYYALPRTFQELSFIFDLKNEL